MTSFEKNLNEFCEKYKLKVPKKDTDNNFVLRFSKGITLHIKDLDPGFYVRSFLVKTPKIQKEEIFMKIMQANLLGDGTGKTVIGAEKNGNFLTLSMSIPYEISYKVFKEEIEDFINYLAYWKEEITKMVNIAKEKLI